MTKHRSTRSVFALCLAAYACCGTAYATCWQAASERYGIPADVLRAIARTESSFNPKAVHKNGNSSEDLGLMQVNDQWLKTLKSQGITRQALLDDPCLNLQVGAWILQRNVASLGWNWQAIGAYNVGCKSLSKGECDKRRNAYAWKVYRSLNHDVAKAVIPAQVAQKQTPIRRTARLELADAADMVAEVNDAEY